MESILVVEDEVPLREAITFKLSREGFKVSQASTGEDAVALLKEEIPDLVWLDIKLPGMSGIDVLKWMRSNPETKNTRVVVVSVSIGTELKDDISQLNVLSLITKSNYSLEDIIIKILDLFAADKASKKS